MQRLNVLLALFAGLLGGIVSGYLLPQRVETDVRTSCRVSWRHSALCLSITQATLRVSLPSALHPGKKVAPLSSCMTLRVANSGTRVGPWADP